MAYLSPCLSLKIERQSLGSAAGTADHQSRETIVFFRRAKEIPMHRRAREEFLFAGTAYPLLAGVRNIHRRVAQGAQYALALAHHDLGSRFRQQHGEFGTNAFRWIHAATQNVP